MNYLHYSCGLAQPKRRRPSRGKRWTVGLPHRMCRRLLIFQRQTSSNLDARHMSSCNLLREATEEQEEMICKLAVLCSRRAWHGPARDGNAAPFFRKQKFLDLHPHIWGDIPVGFLKDLGFRIELRDSSGSYNQFLGII